MEHICTLLIKSMVQKMKNYNVTILVNSCDKYEDAWEPFFRLLKIQWPDCPYDIVLSTETKTYECDFLNVKTINCDKTLSWSSRLKYTLKQIDSEFVLFFLEDFFLLNKVNTDLFSSAISLIENNNDLFLIEFPSVENNYIECKRCIKSKIFKKVYRFEEYRAKVMITLWRKRDFQKIIFENENPWICEKETSIRTMAYNKKIFRQDYRFSIPTFFYHINPKCGYGITGGKWLKNNKPFFEKNGIVDVDYNNLGIEECAKTYRQLAENQKNNQSDRFKELLSNRNIKEVLYYFKRYFFKIFKIDIFSKILKYKKLLKK